MQLKPITAIVVLSLVVASLSVTGCTSSTTNRSLSPTPTPSATPTPEPANHTHPGLIALYVEGVNNTHAQSRKNVGELISWDVTWQNNSTVNIAKITMVSNDSPAAKWHAHPCTRYDYFTFMQFNSAEAATQYFKSHFDGYTEDPLYNPLLSQYREFTGHDATVHNSVYKTVVDNATIITTDTYVQQAGEIVEIWTYHNDCSKAGHIIVPAD